MRLEEKAMAIQSIIEGIKSYDIEPHELFPGINKAVRGPVRLNGSRPKKVKQAKVQRTIWTTEQKKELVARRAKLMKDGMSSAEAGRQLGVKASMLERWAAGKALGQLGQSGGKAKRKKAVKKPAKRAVARKTQAKKVA